MPRLFFVTGLPRSRTAWLSQFFNHGTVACLHEPTTRCGSMKEVRELMESQQPLGWVGAADPNIGLFAEEWLAEFGHDAPIVAIARPAQHCVISGQRAFGGRPADLEYVTAETARGLNQIEEARGSLPTVRYDQLDEKLPELWAEIGLPDPFPVAHRKALARLNIQVQRTAYDHQDPKFLEWLRSRLGSK